MRELTKPAFKLVAKCVLKNVDKLFTNKLIWLIIFSTLSFVIFIRKVDGSGIIQMAATTLTAFIVLSFFLSS
jgi:hypothetical protein